VARRGVYPEFPGEVAKELPGQKEVKNIFFIMTKEKTKDAKPNQDDFKKLLDKDVTKIPQAEDIVAGVVLSASKSEVRLDIDGILTGIVRGRELYLEADEYANLKPGDRVEATVIEEENENGELELSFRHAGQQKAWSDLVDAFKNKKVIKVKVNDANKGGLIVSYIQIPGFLPVSQLAPENYPRIRGGDKGKILEKLRTFIGRETKVKIVTLEEKDEKLIVSEKQAWHEKQKDVIAKYKVGSIVEGKISAITDFGAFITFGKNLEGLIHISELAWQRIDDPTDLYKIGDTIKTEIISIDGAKIFLSAKKLLEDPWKNVQKKYKVGQVVTATILKVNPFGLFVELDKNIHGLAHISQLGLAPGQKIYEAFKNNDKKKFTIISIEAEEHRLGLAYRKEEDQEKPAKKKSISSAVKSEPVSKKEDKEDDEKKTKKDEEIKKSAEKKEKKKPVKKDESGKKSKKTTKSKEEKK